MTQQQCQQRVADLSVSRTLRQLLLMLSKNSLRDYEVHQIAHERLIAGEKARCGGRARALIVLGNPGRNVRLWHLADMLNAPTNVLFWGQSGHGRAYQYVR